MSLEKCVGKWLSNMFCGYNFNHSYLSCIIQCAKHSAQSFFFFLYYLILFSKHSPKLSTVEIHIFKVKKNKFRGIFNITQAVNVGPIWCQYMLSSYWVHVGTSTAPDPRMSYHDAIVISLTMHLFGTWPYSKFSTCFKSFNAQNNLWDKNYCFFNFHFILFF